VTSAISDGAAAMGLTTLAIVVALATESTLVDVAALSAREGHAVVLELIDQNHNTAYWEPQ
jgi:hypothetical protein